MGWHLPERSTQIANSLGSYNKLATRGMPKSTWVIAVDRVRLCALQIRTEEVLLKASLDRGLVTLLESSVDRTMAKTRVFGFHMMN